MENLGFNLALQLRQATILETCAAVAADIWGLAIAISSQILDINKRVASSITQLLRDSTRQTIEMQLQFLCVARYSVRRS